MNMDTFDTPEDLRGIEDAVRDLGEVERASAPESLERNVFLASRQELHEAPVIIAKIGQHRTRQLRVALAAAVAVMATVGAVWMKPSIPASQTAAALLEDDVNNLFALRSSDESMTRVGEKIDTLFIDTGSLGDSLANDPTPALLNEGTS